MMPPMPSRRSPPATRFRDPRRPCRRRAGRADRCGLAADLPDLAPLPRTGSVVRAAGTSTPARRTRPGTGWSAPSRPSRAGGTGSRSPRVRRDGRDRASWRSRARRSWSATTSTAARTATSSASAGRRGGGRPRTPTSRRDPDALWEALTDRTRLVWFETPTNPLLKVIDIAAAARRSRERAAQPARRRPLLVVDNTFASPGAPATARARRGHRLPLGHQVPRRPLATRSSAIAVTRDDGDRPSGCASSRTRWAPSRAVRLLPGLRGLRTLAAAGRAPRRQRAGGGPVPGRPRGRRVVRYPGLADGPHAHPRGRRRGAPDAARAAAGAWSRSCRRPAARHGRTRRSGRSRSRGDPPLHPGRVAGRRRVADRDPGRDDPRARWPAPARGGPGAGPALGRDRGRRRTSSRDLARALDGA